MIKVYFSLEDDIINPCWDNVFKAIFTKDTPESRGALSRFLSAVIGAELTVISITANEPPVADLRNKQIRYDISCKFTDGRLANIEMTISPDKCELVRIEYYGARLFSSQDMRGADKTYDNLSHTYQISVVVNDPVVDDNEIIHHFQYFDIEKNVSLNGRTHIITLELSKLKWLRGKPVKEMTTVERWASFLLYTADKSKRELVNEILASEEGVAMAGSVLLTISKDEVERARLESEYKYAADLQSRMIGAKQEGERIGRREVAKRLKSLGLTPEQIANASGLPVEEVKELN